MQTTPVSAKDILQEVIYAFVSTDQKLSEMEKKQLIDNVNVFLIGQITEQQTRNACLTLMAIVDKHRNTIEYFKSPVVEPAREFHSGKSNRFGL